MARCYRRLSIAPLSCHARLQHNLHIAFNTPKEPMMSPVTVVPAADSAAALAHFAASLSFETDCSDVHAALTANGSPHNAGFVLLDVRSPALYDAGHVPGAVNLPHGKIVASKLDAYSSDTLFVTYCAGPHCNGATRGAIRLAQLGRPVKVMVGGVTGWLDEGFELERRATA
jgi:rhodanese-related sulfurtransferase